MANYGICLNLKQSEHPLSARFGSYEWRQHCRRAVPNTDGRVFMEFAMDRFLKITRTAPGTTRGLSRLLFTVETVYDLLSACCLNVDSIGPLVKFDVCAPGIINEREADAIRIFRIRPVQLDTGGFEFFAECYKVVDVEADVVQRAAFGS